MSAAANVVAALIVVTVLARGGAHAISAAKS
ncbi:hypothetical protein ABIF63_005466 [Bradyrhizobium japonicum]|uniref:Uncharacterized protein n=2 Tax=Bradyrhizobium japonicum TaxID=375 RepID=A0ABV2RYH1_BRAJP